MQFYTRSIQVGCVPHICFFWGGGGGGILGGIQRVGYAGVGYPMGVGYLGKGIPLWKGHGTRDSLPPPPLDR